MAIPKQHAGILTRPAIMKNGLMFLSNEKAAPPIKPAMIRLEKASTQAITSLAWFSTEV